MIVLDVIDIRVECIPTWDYRDELLDLDNFCTLRQTDGMNEIVDVLKEESTFEKTSRKKDREEETNDQIDHFCAGSQFGWLCRMEVESVDSKEIIGLSWFNVSIGEQDYDPGANES